MLSNSEAVVFRTGDITILQFFDVLLYCFFVTLLGPEKTRLILKFLLWISFGSSGESTKSSFFLRSSNGLISFTWNLPNIAPLWCEIFCNCTAAGIIRCLGEVTVGLKYSLPTEIISLLIHICILIVQCKLTSHVIHF